MVRPGLQPETESAVPDTGKIRAASQLRQDNAAKELKRKLNRDRKRYSELDGLIQKLYETFATGGLTEKRFKVLSDSYEREQEELEAAIAQEQAELDSFNADTDRAGQFLELAKRYTDFSVLTNQIGICGQDRCPRIRQIQR